MLGFEHCQVRHRIPAPLDAVIGIGHRLASEDSYSFWLDNVALDRRLVLLERDRSAGVRSSRAHEIAECVDCSPRLRDELWPCVQVMRLHIAF